MRNGIGFFGLLTIFLIALKITGLTTLSWGWIIFILLGPLWALLAFLGIACLVIVGPDLIEDLFKFIRESNVMKRFKGEKQ